MIAPIYTIVSTKRNDEYKCVDDYGRLAIVKIVEKKDILDRRLEDLKKIRSDFIISFFGLTECKDKKDFALFMESCLISMELFFKYKLDPSTRMITEEVKELALDPCIMNLLQKVMEFVFIAFVVMFDLFYNSERYLNTNRSIKVVDIIIYCRKARLLVFIVWT